VVTFANIKTDIDDMLDAMETAGMTLDSAAVKFVVEHYTPESDASFLEIAQTMPASYWDKKLRLPVETKYEQDLTDQIMSERGL
jgi:hypothetical protein